MPHPTESTRNCKSHHQHPRSQLTNPSFSSSKDHPNGEANQDIPRRTGLFSDKITYAFQLATNQGPLCQEPIQGIAVSIEDVTLTATGADELSRLTGEVIRSVKDAVWQGFLDWSPRINLAMYSCEIQASSKIPST